MIKVFLVLNIACKIIGVNQLVLPISKTKTGTPKQDILHNKKYIEENYNRKKIVKGFLVAVMIIKKLYTMPLHLEVINLNYQ